MKYHLQKSRVALMMLLLATSLAAVYSQVENEAFRVFAPDILIVENTGMVPVRPMAELLGATIAVDKHKISVVYRDMCITFANNIQRATLNGRLIRLPQPPFEHNGVIYVPLRILIKTLGGNVDYSRTTNIVTITLPSRNVLTCDSYRTNPKILIDDNEEIYIVDISGKGLRRLTYNNAANYLPLYFNSGKMIAYQRNESIYYRKIGGINEMILANANDQNRYAEPTVSYSHDIVAYTAKSKFGNYINVYNYQDQTNRRLVKGQSPCLSKDGNIVAFNDNGSIYSINLLGNNRRKLCDADTPIMFNADGTVLINRTASAETSQLVSCQIRDDTIRTYRSAKFDSRYKSYGIPELSSTGVTVIYDRYGDDEGISISNLQFTTIKEVTDNSERYPHYFTDDDTVIFAKVENRVTSLYRYVISTKQTTELANLPMRVDAYCFTPDKSQILFISQPEITLDSE